MNPVLQLGLAAAAVQTVPVELPPYTVTSDDFVAPQWPPARHCGQASTAPGLRARKKKRRAQKLARRRNRK